MGKISPKRRRDLLNSYMVSQQSQVLTSELQENELPRKIKKSNSLTAKQMARRASKIQKKNLSRDDIRACSDLEDGSSSTTDSEEERDYNDGDDDFGDSNRSEDADMKLHEGQNKYMLKSVLEDIHMLYSETMFTSRE